MMRLRILALVLFALALAQSVAEAQRQGQDRAALEGRVRERIARVIRERLGLTDEQMQQLGETSGRFDDRRRMLTEQERDIRIALRAELIKGDTANQSRVADLVARMIRVQRERIDIVEEEQAALAAFLTPVQRAKYLAVQDQLRRRVEEMSRERRGPGR
ncbi:MAG: Spy/CpxP family protein refolding chaperone, partial [Gemmatimonadaceae bacterium]